MKKWIATVWLTMVFSMISALFWYNGWAYLQPTPVPIGYRPPGRGQPIRYRGDFIGHQRPVFLHFFNPDCPCSRFNIGQFKKLVLEYGHSVDFLVVAVSNRPYTVVEIQKKFGLDIPVSFDTSIATSCGVYSTPQAVLLDTGHRLYYRGNYNRGRYCADEKTGFAKMAICRLLGDRYQPPPGPMALIPYGCRLPGCDL